MGQCIDKLAKALTSVSTNIVEDCLSCVHIEGDLAKSGSVYGEKGDELIVNLLSGKWADNRNFEHKGDLLNLINFTIGNKNWLETYKLARNYIDPQNDLFVERQKLDIKNVDLPMRKKLGVCYNLWRTSSPLLRCTDIELKILDNTNILYKNTGAEIRFANQIKYLSSTEKSALIFRITDENRKFSGLLRRYFGADSNGFVNNSEQNLPLGDVIGGSFKLGSRKPKAIILTTQVDDVLCFNAFKSRFPEYGFWSGTGMRQTGFVNIPATVQKVIFCTRKGEDAVGLLKKIKSRHDNLKVLETICAPKKFDSFFEFYCESKQNKFLDYLSNRLTNN